MMVYEEAVSYIGEIPKFTTKNSLEHTKECLRRLGDPQEALQVIHVAGTNGKGSVCAYLASIFQEGGYRCGLFTSPHLIRVNERFCIDGEPVGDELFLAAFEKVKGMIDGLLAEGNCHPSYFETLFLMGMWMFREAKVPYVIMETGLGGRLDATNAVEHPMACVITSVSLDHVQYLGDTVEQIAWEKAGIIKPGIPVIYDGNRPETAYVIEKTARQAGAPSYPVTEACVKIQKITSEGIDFTVDGDYAGEVFTTPFIARYQVMNGALALRAAELLRERMAFTREQVRNGIANTKWQGRMEVIRPGIIVDGAHNDDGVARFIETAADFQKDHTITLLFAAVDDKDYPDMIRRISTGIRPAHVVTAKIKDGRAVDAQTLADLFRENGCGQVQAVDNVEEAFMRACSQRGDGLLFCVGSLYLVGEIKGLLQEKAGRVG
jgi:folylpolyglutamate synthase/dihydrofolate synthase